MTKKAWRVLRGRDELLVSLPPVVVAAVATGLNAFPRDLLFWRGDVAQKALDSCLHAYVHNAPRKPVSILQLGYLLTTLASAKRLDEYPDLQIVGVALIRLLMAVESNQSLPAPTEEEAHAVARLIRRRPAVAVVPAVSSATSVAASAASAAALQLELTSWLATVDKALVGEAHAAEIGVDSVRRALTSSMHAPFPEARLTVFGSRASVCVTRRAGACHLMPTRRRGCTCRAQMQTVCFAYPP